MRSDDSCGQAARIDRSCHVATAGVRPAGWAHTWPIFACLLVLLTCTKNESQVEHARQVSLARANDVATWALGERLRMVRKKPRSAARLLVVPQQGAPRALLQRCVNARSVLPSHVNPQQIFAIIDGALHIIDIGATPPAILPVALEPAHIVLSDLLAMSRRAPPLEILALAQHPVSDGQMSAPALWRIVLSAERAHAAPVAEQPQLTDPAAFFQHYSAPRCREDGRDCLLVANGDQQGFLDVESHPGGTRREWRTLEAATIEDARWHRADETSALLLVRCQQQPP